MTRTILHLTDEFDLWLHFKSGDKTALEEIYRRYAGVLYNYGFHFVKNPELVEDALQDLFVVLWESRERLSDTTSVKYYLFRSMRRQLTRLLRKCSSSSLEEVEPAHTLFWVTPSAEADWIAMETTEGRLKELRNALQELTPRQLEAIRLFYFEGFDLTSVARIMEMNEQSVRNTMQRAFVKLRHVLHLFPLLLPLLKQV